jgi:3'(2'), 5'-bisphosphate nucleotidase
MQSEFLRPAPSREPLVVSRRRAQRVTAQGHPDAGLGPTLASAVPDRRPPGMSASDHEAARRIADEAGRLLLDVRARLDTGASPDDVRAEGDRRSNTLLLDLLRRDFPADAVLSEEAPDDLRRLDARRVWIVDPLDGTREFGEIGRGDWAVHVALVEDGALAAGAVALPAQGVTYATDAPAALGAVDARAPRIAVSRTRPAAEAQAVAAALEGELVPMGSAGAKAMAVVSGEIDVYVHSGGQYAWDSAAPVAVAAAAGLHTSRADGSPLRYNQAESWLPDLLICRPELAADVLAVLCG